MEATATAKFMRVSPRKARLVVDLRNMVKKRSDHVFKL
jgi:ribosomal protein L22